MSPGWTEKVRPESHICCPTSGSSKSRPSQLSVHQKSTRESEVSWLGDFGPYFEYLDGFGAVTTLFCKCKLEVLGIESGNLLLAKQSVSHSSSPNGKDLWSECKGQVYFHCFLWVVDLVANIRCQIYQPKQTKRILTFWEMNFRKTEILEVPWRVFPKQNWQLEALPRNGNTWMYTKDCFCLLHASFRGPGLWIVCD